MKALALLFFVLTLVSSFAVFVGGMSSNPGAGDRFARSGLLGTCMFWTAFVVCITVVIIRSIK